MSNTRLACLALLLLVGCGDAAADPRRADPARHDADGSARAGERDGADPGPSADAVVGAEPELARTVVRDAITAGNRAERDGEARDGTGLRTRAAQPPRLAEAREGAERRAGALAEERVARDGTASRTGQPVAEARDGEVPAARRGAEARDGTASRTGQPVAEARDGESPVGALAARGDLHAREGTQEGSPGGGAAARRRRAERFFDRADAPIREALATEAIEAVERGHGGRSLSFRVTLADGTSGYFKPAQTFNGMRWQSEIAAYHLDRELGLGRVAPVVGRSIPFDEIEGAASGDGRADELRPGEDGSIDGAFVWWVPERLVPLPLPDGWERWLRVEGEPARVSPFQRPGEYRRATPRSSPAPEPAEPEGRAAELSDLIVFDYLTQNLDRWGTNNTNVRTVGEGGPLMFLDNAAAFVLRSPRIALMDARLEAVQRFRRSTIDAVRRLDVDRFAERLADDPLAPELDQRQLDNLEARRARLLAYVDALVEEHGEDAVYAW